MEIYFCGSVPHPLPLSTFLNDAPEEQYGKKVYREICWSNPSVLCEDDITFLCTTFLCTEKLVDLTLQGCQCLCL